MPTHKIHFRGELCNITFPIWLLNRVMLFYWVSYMLLILLGKHKTGLISEEAV